MKVAVIHDWLRRFTEGQSAYSKIYLSYFQMLMCLPSSISWIEIITSFINRHKVHTSFIEKLPFAKKNYRNYLPLMPIAIEQFNLTGYDIVISSSFAVAKGVITAIDQVHISYVHSPMRYAWDLQFQYLKESGLEKGLKGAAAKYVLHKMRMWDCRTANSVDYYIVNSNFIAKRI